MAIPLISNVGFTEVSSAGTLNDKAGTAKSKLPIQFFRLTDNISAKLWEKFIFLSAYSGITTLTSKTIGEIFDDSKLEKMFIKAMTETYEVSKRFKIKPKS